METDEEVGEIHSSAAAEGQSDAPAIDEEVDTHFICFRSSNDHCVLHACLIILHDDDCPTL